AALGALLFRRAYTIAIPPAMTPFPGVRAWKRKSEGGDALTGALPGPKPGWARTGQGLQGAPPASRVRFPPLLRGSRKALPRYPFRCVLSSRCCRFCAILRNGYAALLPVFSCFLRTAG